MLLGLRRTLRFLLVESSWRFPTESTKLIYSESVCFESSIFLIFGFICHTWKLSPRPYQWVRFHTTIYPSTMVCHIPCVRLPELFNEITYFRIRKKSEQILRSKNLKKRLIFSGVSIQTKLTSANCFSASTPDLLIF